MSLCYVGLEANGGNEGSLISSRLQGLLIMHVQYTLEAVIEIPARTKDERGKT